MADIAWTDVGYGWFHSAEPIAFPILRASVTVGVVTDPPASIPATQLAAIEALRLAPLGRRDEWSAAVFADCREAIDADQCELDAPDLPTRCRVPEDVWSLVRWRRVVVPEQGDSGDRLILLHGRPAWRIEHGLQLALRNERLVWVGRADWMLFERSGLPAGWLPPDAVGSRRVAADTSD